MENMKYIGMSQSIDTASQKIKELKAQGYNESNIYAITNTEENISMLRGKMDVEHHGAAYDNWLNSFTVFLNGEEPILDALSQMGFSEQQSRNYYNEVKNGGVALFSEDGVTKLYPDEMDSSAELGLSGEVLDGQDDNQQVVDNEATVPRLNTRNL